MKFPSVVRYDRSPNIVTVEACPLQIAFSTNPHLDRAGHVNNRPNFRRATNGDRTQFNFQPPWNLFVAWELCIKGARK